MTIKRILIPVDFSRNSLRALDYAVDLGKPFKAELMVLFVVEPIYYTVPDFAVGAAATMGQLIEEQLRSGRAQLTRLAQRCAKRRIKVRPLLQTGTAHQAIADTAKQLKADLIVMATHGRTGVSHLLMGSVAERVVRTAMCPVLTLHAGTKMRRAAAGKAGQRATKTTRRAGRRPTAA